MQVLKHWVPAGAMAVAIVAVAAAQDQRPMSPPGTAATQVGGQWVKTERGQRYEGGKWIEVVYGRPLLRARGDIFGSGAEYGKGVYAGAPVWRVGANVSTRFKTEAPLSFAGKTLPAGEYSMFAELKENEWTLIFSSWAAQPKFDREDKTALWGAYGYTPDKDVLRAPMQLGTLPFSMDQMTIGFVDMTNTGGKLAVIWEKTIATAAFTVAGS